MLDQPMNKSKIAPVLLCGGSGTRMWPLSRVGFPKQFLSLTGKESLSQQAAMRLFALGADGSQVSNFIIVSSEKHRLANPGTIPLEIIEVQSGSYLGEDDIVRFEDHYGRTKS